LARGRGNSIADPLYPLTEVVRIGDPFVQPSLWDSIQWLAIRTRRVIFAEVEQNLIMEHV